MNCVHADLIYTGRKIVVNAHIVFRGEKCVAISKERRGTLVGEFKAITPAIVDPHCHIGMHRSGEPATEGEANERLDSILPLPDALDSVLTDDLAFAESVEMGVLYSCVVPGSGNILGGRSAVIRNYARNTSEALIARAGIKAALGFNTSVSTRDWKGARPYTRMGALALLRKRFDDVRQKMEKLRAARGKAKREIVFNAEERVLRDLLAGTERLRVHVHKSDDVACLTRLVKEFNLRVTAEHTMDVTATETYSDLKRLNIPVVYGPMDSFDYKTELRHESWRNVRALLQSGVTFGLMTDHPVTLQRNLLLSLRHFLRLGLSRQEAIEIITRRNAEVLGLDNIIGTLARGRWASFIGWNGDPFDLGAWPVAVYGEGRKLYED